MAEDNPKAEAEPKPILRSEPGEGGRSPKPLADQQRQMSVLEIKRLIQRIVYGYQPSSTPYSLYAKQAGELHYGNHHIFADRHFINFYNDIYKTSFIFDMNGNQIFGVRNIHFDRQDNMGWLEGISSTWDNNRPTVAVSESALTTAVNQLSERLAVIEAHLGITPP
jgi:hypothetical protein